MSDVQNELVLTRLIDAPPENLFRCWTEPQLIKQWFAPRPYTTPIAEVELRVGGHNLVIMKSPEGQEIPYSGDWIPSGKPFMTAILTFEPEDGKTRYTARVRHWSKEDYDAHEKMGFHQGWGQCADQLAELAKSL